MQSTRHGQVLAWDTAPPPVFTLPSELMEMVAEELPPSDLPALRSTCKEVNHKIFRVFTNAYFLDKAFLLSSKSSMEVLKDITSHPELLKAIKHIRLSLMLLHD